MNVFFGEEGKRLDKYSQIYSKLLLIGDFNDEESESVLAQSLHDGNAVNRSEADLRLLQHPRWSILG